MENNDGWRYSSRLWAGLKALFKLLNTTKRKLNFPKNEDKRSLNLFVLNLYNIYGLHPFFLSPGRHVLEDIPELVKQASEAFDVSYTITDPLGVHGSILNVIDDIITKEF